MELAEFHHCYWGEEENYKASSAELQFGLVKITIYLSHMEILTRLGSEVVTQILLRYGFYSIVNK